MTQLRNSIEEKLNQADPVGAQIRKLKKRLIMLEKKGNVTSKEYKELSSGYLKLKDLEQQRKELASFQTMLDPKAGKLIKISKAFDKITEQYDAGKVDKVVYQDTLRKLWPRLNEEERVLSINVTSLDNGPVTTNLLKAFEQGCMAFILIMVVIPVLFSCSFHS